MSNMFKTESCDLERASRKTCFCSEYEDRFVRAVNQFIASYRGTRLNEFAVHFCLMRSYASDVLNWIRFGLDLGVEVLDMQLFGEHCKYKVSWHTLCRISLMDLLVSDRDVGESLTHPFGHLKALIFHRICLKSTLLVTFLSSLVNLKQLEMKECYLPRNLFLNSLTSLEGASVLHCIGLEKIGVASLKLKSLKVLCARIVLLDLTRAPNLKELCCSGHDGSMRHTFLKLPELLPRLRTLRLDSSSNWLEHMPESAVTFSRLRRLKVELDPEVGDMMFKMVQILKSCPLLRHLNTWLGVREDKEHEKLESVEYHHECLEWITIQGFVGTKYQIESCKYLLKLAPRAKELGLKRVLPDTLSRLTSEEECESAVNELKAFSNDTKVFFL